MGGPSQTLEVQGHLLRLDLFIWKDLQPGGVMEGNLNLSLHLKEETGGVIPEGVILEKVFLEQNSDQREINFAKDYYRFPSQHEIKTKIDSSWPIGSVVQARIQIQTLQGEHIVRMENVKITQVD